MTCKFTVKMKARGIYTRKQNDFSGVGGTCKFYRRNEGQGHFTRENTTISPGSAGVTCKFTVELKARGILHEKTQRFLRGRWRREQEQQQQQQEEEEEE